MARLFTAIELEPAVRAAVADLQAAAARRLHDPGFRLVPPAQLHLTLVFVGEVDEPRVPHLSEAMSRDVPCAPFMLAFGGWGVFPPRGPAPQRVASVTLFHSRLLPTGAEHAVLARAALAGPAPPVH